MFDFDNPLTYKAYVQMSPLTIRYEYEHDLQEDFLIKILCITFIEDINTVLFAWKSSNEQRGLEFP